MLPGELQIDSYGILWRAKPVMGIPMQGNTQTLCVSGRVIAVNLEFTWQHLLWASMASLYDYVIHIAIIATLHIPLITSFQPPLVVFWM